ncbi:hypothetical protein V9L05_08375 [Bernardetia sp. Wsw4-3y2]|uniref:hypothetical protein n=1 Tax=Bernardetia sp. Wsw4-3y2 TaxID=3127471 RepID=UPI0030D39F60
MSVQKSIRKKFKDSFEIKCLKLFVSAYKSAIKNNSVKIDLEENDITAELNRYINENPLRLEWQIHTNVEHHLPKNDTQKTKGFSAKLARIDLRFSNFVSTFEHIYFIEAKNIEQKGLKGSQLKRRYINTGIDNFTSKKYENGCLVGYLLKGNLELTVEGINSLLKKDKRDAEFLNFKKSDLHDFYYESEHIEIGILKHFIFDFTEK